MRSFKTINEEVFYGNKLLGVLWGKLMRRFMTIIDELV